MIVSWDELMPHVVHDLRALVRQSLIKTQLVEKQIGPALNPETAALLRASIEAQQKLNQFALRLGALAQAHKTQPRELVELEIAILGAKLHCKNELDESKGDFLAVGFEGHQVPVQIQLILQELIGNSIRYRHPERRLQIRVDALEHMRDGTEGLCLSVSDNGSGWDPAFQSKLMTPLERLDATRGGFGLGLAIAQTLTESCGGVLSGETTSAGSRFTVELPRP
ncbi:MAG: ATP-binding protein [Bryobacteraceae bacterium]